MADEYYKLVLDDKEELLSPVRQEFYLIDDVRSDYLESLLRKSAVFLNENFGVKYNKSLAHKMIVQDLVRYFYRNSGGKEEKDFPRYLMRMINQCKLQGVTDETKN